MERLVLTLAGGETVAVPVGQRIDQMIIRPFRKDIAAVTIPIGVKTIGISALYKCTSLASLTIPEGVTSINPGAFRGCTSLASVTIPVGVTTIGEYTFEECTSLASVIIPKGVPTIEASVFFGCTSLASVIIPEGVTTIKNRAFGECTSLVSVLLPNSAVEVNTRVFIGCTSLALAVASDAACNTILSNQDLPFVYRPTVIDYVFTFKRTGQPSLALYTPEAIRQSQQLEFWSPRSHFLCNSARKEWVKFVLLLLTRRLHLPHVVAVIVLQSMRRGELR